MEVRREASTQEEWIREREGESVHKRERGESLNVMEWVNSFRKRERVREEC